MSLNIDVESILGPIFFCDFADQCEELWQIYLLPSIGQFGRTAVWQNFVESLFLSKLWPFT